MERIPNERDRTMRFLRTHNTSVAACYGCLAAAKAVVGGFFEAAVYLVASLVHIHAAVVETRSPRTGSH
jgi:hypothetical protein